MVAALRWQLGRSARLAWPLGWSSDRTGATMTWAASEQDQANQASEADQANLRPRTGPIGWFGRPVHLEARGPLEQLRLRRSPLWASHGIPAGDDRPLLLIPGFLAKPRSTQSLQRVLVGAGWRVRVAAVGRNSGPAYVGVEAAERDLFELAESDDRPVTIIGHSRGGQYARILAVRHPATITQVVALGAPFLVKYPRFAPLRMPISVLEWVWRAGAFGHVDPERESSVDRDRWAAFPDGIDFVSIYSRSDGFVDWRTCLDPAAHPVEVVASHRGLLNSVAGISAVAAALGRHHPTDG